MTEDLESRELLTYYNRVLENGKHGLEEIKIFQARQLRCFAQSLADSYFDTCLRLMQEASPDQYPSDYRGGRELDFWLEKNTKPNTVLEIVDTFLESTTPNEKGKDSTRFENIKAELETVEQKIDQRCKELTGYYYNEDVIVMPLRDKIVALSKDEVSVQLKKKKDRLQKEKERHPDFMFGYLNHEMLTYDFYDKGNSFNWVVKLRKLGGEFIRDFIRYHSERTTLPQDEFNQKLKDLIRLSDINGEKKTIITEEIEAQKNKIESLHHIKSTSEIEKHQYNLIEFIDLATRWSIDSLFNLRRENNMPPVVDGHVMNSRPLFETFKTELRKEVDKPENGRAFEVDIKDRFLPMIKSYYQWFDEHKAETKKFEPYNFYEWMYGVMVSTEHEINKYFQTAQQETKATEIKPTEELSKIGRSENKFWKGLPMEIVIKHFEVMTQRKNKKGEYYLTTEQLISFLKRGFLNDLKQSKQKINCSNGEKGFVISRFYQFYDLAASQYGHPSKKENFINLFNNCFDNWDAGSIKDLFKPNKTKEAW